MDRNTHGDIDSSRIPVEGIGGLGLVLMAVVVAYYIQSLRPLAIWSIGGGVILGLILIAERHRRERRWAVALLALIAVVLLIALGEYWWRLR